MDRQIVYAGSIPLDTDLLHIQRNVQVALGALTQAVLGSGPLVDGLIGVPGAAPYSVTVLPGSLTVMAANDVTGFGGLAADATQVVQTGLLPSEGEVRLGSPADAGHVICWLVQAQVAATDGSPLALPYWNASNPSVPYAGPGNSGLAQPTTRVLRVALAAKANAPESGAVGTPPEPDAGWVGLFSVTTFFGKPGVEAGDILPFHSVPRMRYTLPAMPPGLTQQAVFASGGAWTAPDGVQWARVRIVGGGGGGGGGDSGFSGGGGGAGGYAEGIVSVQPRQGYAVVVGVGGLAGGTRVNGGPGGSTTFGGGLLSALGGQGGASANPDSHGGAPGTGTGGSLLLAGGYGGDGALVAFVPGGGGGTGAFGGGGRGASAGGVPANGLAYGSGGGGGYGASSGGGAGAGGLVVIEF